MLWNRQFALAALLFLVTRFVTGLCRTHLQSEQKTFSPFSSSKTKLAKLFPVSHSRLCKDSRINLVADRTALNQPDRFGRLKDALARSAGYVMGTGAMLIYAPILIKIIRRGNADGFALETWIYNVLGMSLAVAYPLKKGFPVSTYLELLAAFAQSMVILGLIGFYQGRIYQLGVGLGVFLVIFAAFIKSKNIHPKLLSAVQIAAMLIANYANVPQILLSFKTKSASWSGITALMSVAGCFIRILTTLQLTKDGLVIAGYVLGLVTNGILLGQVLVYGQA